MRFPEFTGEWENTEIKNILKIGSGRDYKHLEIGNIPVFGTGGYMTSVNDFLYNGESVCIGRKGTINKPFYLTGKFWTVDTLFYTHSYKKVQPKFLFYIFEQINWLKYNEASGVPSLSKSTIEKIPIAIPKKEEQQKIAQFLFLLDQRIETQNKIIEELKKLKTALVDKLYNCHNRKPLLRLSRFSGYWQPHTYGDLLQVSSARNTNQSINRILSASQVYGMIEREYMDIDIKFEQESTRTYKIVYPGDYIIHLRSFQGGFAFSEKEGICSPAYTVLRPSILLKYGFLKNHFTSSGFIKSLKIVTYGIRDGRSISVEEFLKLPITIPSLSEQNEINKLFSAINNKIENENSVQQLLTTQKHQLLKRIFI